MIVEKRNSHMKIGISVSMIIMMLILASMRDLQFGTDLVGYNASFIRLSDISWKETLVIFNFNTVNEPFFYYFTKIIADLGLSFNFYLILLLAISMYFTHLTLKRYSSAVALSYLIYISLGYYFFNLNGIRQSLSIGLLLYSFHFLIINKNLKFVFFVLFASLFHVSALAFLVFLLIRNIRLTDRLLIISFIILGIVFVFSSEIIELMLSISFIAKYSYYLSSGIGLNYTSLLIHASILLFIYISNKNTQYTIVGDLIMKSLVIGLVFIILSTVVAEFFRVAMYFNILSIIAVPLAIDRTKHIKNRVIILSGIVFLLITYVFVSGMYFEFGW